jgi:cation diffusion facilitator CzcD-associated flavoprotein CzcO
MAEEIDVVVVGAGQAGLAVSHELTQAGIGHVVLERDRPVGAARRRARARRAHRAGRREVRAAWGCADLSARR